MANAKDFFDPSIMHARFVGDRVASLNEKDLIAHGATKIAQWEFTLDANAQLKTLERHVREEALGKVFGDGEVFDAITESRTADVSFYKLKDGSGVSIAKLNGGENAMLALLSKADFADLILMPRAPQRKAASAPTQAKIQLANGQELPVQLAAPEQAPAGAPIAMPGRAMGPIQVNMGNPVAAKEFLARAWTSTSQALPMPDAADLAHASIAAATTDALETDETWPEGIRVVDKATGEAISGPSKALKMFAAALEGREGPVIERESLADQFAARRKNKAGM